MGTLTRRQPSMEATKHVLDNVKCVTGDNDISIKHIT
jgi:hypothetical protein